MSEKSAPSAAPNAAFRAASLCVCVPARNEAERLPILLRAISEQDWPGTICVSIAVNNTTDDSLERITEARARYAGRLALHVAVARFPVELAHAGSARRLAMTEGLRRLADLSDGVLVSTDVDARPPVDWLRNTAAAFDRGADLVGGKIVIDGREVLPDAVIRLRARWDRYWARVRAIEDEIDPVAWDPAPRHGDHTGASLAIRASLYLACGGVPLVPTGEDLALVRAAVAHGGRLVHPADVHVLVSPRTAGRAEGGMASAMRDLFQAARDAAPPMVPAFGHWAERAAWRRQVRHGPDGHRGIARLEATLPAMPHDMRLEETP
jgi:cellulose synthase/poly-beta-1,6-N-acetylglucosamine synthase-like glycosyltransferase